VRERERTQTGKRYFTGIGERESERQRDRETACHTNCGLCLSQHAKLHVEFAGMWDGWYTLSSKIKEW